METRKEKLEQRYSEGDFDGYLSSNVSLDDKIYIVSDNYGFGEIVNELKSRESNDLSEVIDYLFTELMEDY